MEIKFETQEFLSYSEELQRSLARQTKNVDLISAILKVPNIKVLVSLSENKSLTADHLDTLSKINHSRINKNVAKNVNASPETLDYLSKCGSKAIIEAIAENPSTADDTLRYIYLEKNIDIYVLRCILNNPSASEETKERVSNAIKRRQNLRYSRIQNQFRF